MPAVLPRSKRPAIASACRLSSTLVPVTTIEPTPAPRARATTSSRSAANDACPRFAPISTRRVALIRASSIALRLGGNANEKIRSHPAGRVPRLALGCGGGAGLAREAGEVHRLARAGLGRRPRRAPVRRAPAEDVGPAGGGGEPPGRRRRDRDQRRDPGEG